MFLFIYFLFIFILFYFFLFFPFIFISWRLITLQYCRGFCHTLTWINQGFTCVSHPDPPSCLPPHPIPLGLPSAPALSIFNSSNWRNRIHCGEIYPLHTDDRNWGTAVLHNKWTIFYLLVFEHAAMVGSETNAYTNSTGISNIWHCVLRKSALRFGQSASS